MPRFLPLLRQFVWEVINPIILEFRRNKPGNWDERYHGLNLGCGLDNPPNWLGIDGGVFVLFRGIPEACLRRMFPLFNMSEVYDPEQYIGKLRRVTVMHHDLLDGIPFNSNTVPSIYSSHFLEHLPREQGGDLLRESFRVLSPGGMIRIAVPSLGNEIEHLRAALYQYDQGNIEPVMPYVTGIPGFVAEYSVHHHMYNFDDLCALLESVGFSDIVECSYKVGAICDVELLDTRKDSLFVEGRKSDRTS